MIFDIDFFKKGQKEAIEKVLKLAELPNASSVLFTNVHVTVEANRDPSLMKVIKDATLVIPDGKPIQWVLNAKGEKSAQRYSGPDLMEDLFARTARQQHFFIGSSQKVLDKFCERFGGSPEQFYSPPFKEKFDEAEMQRHIDMVTQFGADFIWVGLGAPKQERYVVEMAQRAKKGVWLAVGAAFDFYAGTKPRAPKIVQDIGMEWAFRWASEPRRLTSRYLDTNTAFIKLCLKEFLKKGAT